MIFSYKWLQSFFEKSLPKPEKLGEILTLHAFEVEKIKEVEGLSEKDWQLHIDVLPNRPDCYSHLGIAREISAILGYKLKIPRITVKEEKSLPLQKFAKFRIKEGCQRYSARVILGVEIGESPLWLQERLKVCGILPINNVVDVTNYVMLHLGQPLHAFDLEKIKGREIVVRKAKKDEKIVTLDDEEYDLTPNILVIADKEKPLAIAGIKGGKESGISQNTQLILIESANFFSEIIKKGSREIDLETDASFRFSHGIDPQLTTEALDLAAFLLQQIGNAKVAKGIFDYYPKKKREKTILLEKDFPSSVLGIEISLKREMELLRNLGFKTEIAGKKLKVIVPSFRLDIERKEDLVEEIGRIEGYQRIKSSSPLIEIKTPAKNNELFWENFVKDLLKEMNFTETLNYSFLGENLLQLLGFSPEELIEVLNPATVDHKFLRPTLLGSLLKNVQKNLPYFSKMRIFELGKVFRKFDNKIQEKKMLAGILVESDFLEGKGVVDTILSKMGITDYWFDFYQPTPEDTKSILWHLKKSSEIKIGDKEIGFLGEISQSILLNLNIQKKVTAFELDFELLSKIATEEYEFEIPSPYPPILRDISVIVPFDVLVEKVIQKIYSSDPTSISDIDLIDIYDFPGEDRKSLTFRIVFQLKDRAIQSSEVEEKIQKIIKNLEENPNWEVRK